MLHRIAIVGLIVSFLAFTPTGNAEQEKPVALGLDQKLERLYELYRAGETVSLLRREMRFNLGFAYSVQDDNVLGLQSSGNTATLHGTFALGIANWLEAAVSIPFQWHESRIETPGERLADSSELGIGGASIRLIAALPTKAFETSMVASFTLPTGDRAFEADRFHSLIGINIAKVMRPAFVFGGLAWQRDWDQTLDGVLYSGGVGFFLNHTLSLGVEIGGTRFLDPPLGHPYDTASATTRVTYQATPSFGLAPFVNIGLTDSAPDSTIGANLFWRF